MLSKFSSIVFLEIPGFLTSEECDWLVNLTKSRGMFNSQIHMDPDAIAHEKKIKSLIGNGALTEPFTSETVKVEGGELQKRTRRSNDRL